MRSFMLFVLGLVLGALLMRGPACPEEDSCRADYYGGAWHIVREP